MSGARRFARLALMGVVLCAASGCFLWQRPNPRLSRLHREQGAQTLTVTLDYNDDGTLAQVVSDGALSKQTTKFSWKDGRITKVAIVDNPVDAAFDTIKTTTTLSYDDEGRLERAEDDVEDPDPNDETRPAETITTLSYDPEGRFDTMASTTSNGTNSAVKASTGFTWDDDGNLERLDATQRVEVQGRVTQSATTRYEVTEKDGLPKTLKVITDELTSTLVTSVADGRLDSFEGTRTFTDDPDREDTLLVGFAYDDADRLSAVTVSDDDGLSEDPVTELSYDDGDAVGIDVTSYAIFFAGLWDMKGQGHLRLDTGLQAPRFVLPPW